MDIAMKTDIFLYHWNNCVRGLEKQIFTNLTFSNKFEAVCMYITVYCEKIIR